MPFFVIKNTTIIYFNRGGKMNSRINRRVINEALYILDTKSTIRETAKIYNVSKSTVHKDLNERLYNIDIKLYNKINEILEEHIKTRHIKGGESTRLKYLKNA